MLDLEGAGPASFYRLGLAVNRGELAGELAPIVGTWVPNAGSWRQIVGT